MMAFANNYVVSVIVNDKPQREFSANGKRSIQLPFDTEYKIRLKNQTNLRALVNVSIDGAPVFMGGRQLILEPRQSLDLERFVNDLDSGRKFKFMKKEKLGDNGHFDPTTSDLGKLSVEFVPEFELRLGALGGGLTTYTSNCNPWIVSEPQSHQLYRSVVTQINAAYDSLGPTGNMGPRGDKGIVSSNSYSEVPLSTSDSCSIGGTVEGGVSSQEFKESTSSIFWEYGKKTTIDIYMIGPSQKVELTKAEKLAKKFYDEFGGNYDCAPRDIQKALAFVVEKTILHTVLDK